MLFNCAFDLGASSGRVMVSEWDGQTLKLTEIHRFPNEPVSVNGVLYWDVLRLFHEMKTGLRKIALKKIPLAGIGIDAWGVDYGLLDPLGNLIGMPIHYRDSRTEGQQARMDKPADALYARTGIQIMNINTIFQLMADTEMRPDILQAASDLLFIPDLFAYFLTGVRYNEYTIASTSQLLNAETRTWDRELLSTLGSVDLNGLLKPVVKPGTVIGGLTETVLAETGLDASVKLIAVGSHDTASAVAGTPLSGEGSAYLSCGTWSLLGMELDTPDSSRSSFEREFTNEGGVGGKIRYLKNINGLWLIQRLLASHNEQASAAKKLGFADLMREAEKATNQAYVVSPNDPAFVNPLDMAAAVREYCERMGQGVPQGIGETAVAVYRGLTREYNAALQDLEALRGQPIHTLHMVGGGIRDTLLCRLTAQTTGKRVIAGPVEASVLGNITTQLMGLGAINSLEEGRAIIRESFQPEIYE